MALPLDPDIDEGMFPETESAPFVVAPQVLRLLDDVAASFDAFRTLRQARTDGYLSIECVFETKPFDQTKEEFKPHTIAKVTKASPLWRALTDRDVVVQFRQTFWEMFTVEQRRAVLHHELSHIAVDFDTKGRPSIALRPHEVEDFSGTMRAFGPILPSRKTFVKAYLDWQHEQDVPEPTPIRPVPAAGDGDDDDTLDDLTPEQRAGVMAAGRKLTSVTLSTSGPGMETRSTTIHGKGRAREQHGYRVEPTGCPVGDCALGEGHDGDHLPVRP